MFAFLHLGGKGKAPASANQVAPALSARAMLLPLGLAQFIASFAGSNMNVAISDIAADLGTSVTGVQTAITVFTLTMAALMIPGSKLTDIFGRKKCFVAGLGIYGIGTAIAALAPAIGVLIIGYSLLEGIGSALMIPPIYILVTVSFPDIKARAKAFGVVSAMAAIGSATGPLIGGLITSAISWRASFGLQMLVVVFIILLSRRIVDTGIRGPKPAFDVMGAILSAAGLVFIVLGILQAGSYGWLEARKDFTIGDTVVLHQGDISPVIVLVVIGLAFLLWFFLHIRSRERAGKEPLLATHLFRNLTSNLGLVTQNIQWLTMLGSFFLVSLFLQLSLEYSAIQTGLVLTAATIGVLISSLRAEKMAAKYSQRTLIRAGFILTTAGIVLLLLFVDANSSAIDFLPGLFLLGLGVGIMVTASVNVVQSSFEEEDQGEISGLSRCVSNLGSSFGTAIAGAVLISGLISGVTSLTNESQVLPSEEKQQIYSALQGDISAVSNSQIEATLVGQPEAVVDEVTRINEVARNRALGRALIVMAFFGLAGLGAALFLPPDAKKSSPSA